MKLKLSERGMKYISTKYKVDKDTLKDVKFSYDYLGPGYDHPYRISFRSNAIHLDASEVVLPKFHYKLVKFDSA